MADVYFFPENTTDFAGFTDKIIFVPRATDNAEITESFTVPASLKYQGPMPLEGTVPTVTVDAASRVVTETTPSAGQAKIDRSTGIWTFHSADAAGTAEVTMLPYVTWASSAFLRNMQDAGDVVGPASSVDNTVPRYNLATGKLIQGSGVAIDDSDNITTTGAVNCGSLNPSTALPLAKGGTGSSTAAGARTNLGLGTTDDVEFADALFTGSGGVTATGGRIIARQASGGSGFEAYSYGSNSIFNCFRAQGSVGSETTIGSGRTIGRFQFVGHDGTDYMSGARLVGITTETWTGSARGTKFQLEATSTGTTTLETKMETTDLGIEVLSQITFTTAITTASASNNSVFINSADGKLTFKNSSGTSTALY